MLRQLVTYIVLWLTVMYELFGRRWSAIQRLLNSVTPEVHTTWQFYTYSQHHTLPMMMIYRKPLDC